MQTAAKSVVIAESSWEESVSAWMDGEESDDVLAGLLTREGQQTWDTYHLIGDALRNSDLALTPSAAFQARLARALDAELPIVAAPRRRSPLRMGLSGLAVAAAVATVAWVAQPIRPAARRAARPACWPTPARASAPKTRACAIISKHIGRWPAPAPCARCPSMPGRAADGLGASDTLAALGRAATWPAHRAAWFAATLFAAFRCPRTRSRGRRHAAAPEDMVQLLSRIQQAARKQDYAGVFMYQQGETIQSSRLVHVLTAPASASAWKSWTASRANICAITKMCSA